jgi:hypothetical protein
MNDSRTEVAEAVYRVHIGGPTAGFEREEGLREQEVKRRSPWPDQTNSYFVIESRKARDQTAPSPTPTDAHKMMCVRPQKLRSISCIQGAAQDSKGCTSLYPSHNLKFLTDSAMLTDEHILKLYLLNSLSLVRYSGSPWGHHMIRTSIYIRKAK